MGNILLLAQPVCLAYCIVILVLHPGFRLTYAESVGNKMVAKAIFMHVYENYKEQLPRGNLVAPETRPQLAHSHGLMDMLGNIIRSNGGSSAAQPQTKLERYFNDQYPISQNTNPLIWYKV